MASQPRFAECLVLGLCFDALCDDTEAEGVGDFDDQLDDDLILTDLEVADEAAIDLEDVDRETPELADRGVAGAEVVDRDAHAERARFRRGGRQR